MPPLLPGSSILTKSPDSRNGKNSRKTESRKIPLWKRAQLYTTSGSGALRPAGGVLRTADDFRRFSICSNHHRGSYTSPALAYASYPFVDLPDRITLRCKPFPSDKISEIQLYFFDGIAYNGASDKSRLAEWNKFERRLKCHILQLKAAHYQMSKKKN